MQEYIEIIRAIPQVKPLVSLTLENLKAYKDEYTQIKTFLIEESVDTKARIYQGLIAKGIPPEHALALTISIEKGYTEVINKSSAKKKADK